MIDWKKLAVGDWVKVRFETPKCYRTDTVSGQINNLYLDEEGHISQAQIEGGWFFHSCDTLLEHVKEAKT